MMAGALLSRSRRATHTNHIGQHQFLGCYRDTWRPVPVQYRAI